MSTSKRRKTDSDDVKDKRKKLNKNLEDLGENWRDKCNGILENHGYALGKNILTDVTFIVGPESIAIPAHRLLLALGSPVFEAMFYGGLAEKGESITIPDVSAKGFRHLLRYLYSEDVIFTDDGDAFQTYVAADKYCVTNLKVECEKYLNDTPLTSTNIWLYLESSLLLNSQTITERCIRFLKYNIKTALLDPLYLQASPKTIENLLSLSNLYVSESNLIRHVMRWALRRSKLDPSLAFKDMMTPILPLIQFGALSPLEYIKLSEEILMRDLISDQESLSILKHICEPGIYSLPAWCCTERSRMVSNPTRQNHQMKSKSVQTIKFSFNDYTSSSSSSASSSSDSLLSTTESD